MARSLLGQASAASTVGAFCVAFVLGQLVLESRGDWVQADAYWSWLNHGAVACAGNVSVLLTPSVARNWLSWFVLLAATASLLERFSTKWLAVVASFAVSIVLPTRLLWASVYLQRGDRTSIAYTIGLGLAVFGVWQFRRRTQCQDRRFCAWLTLAVVGTASLTLAMSGSVTYGQHAAALASGLFGLLVAAIAFRDAVDWTLVEGPITLAFGGLLVIGTFFAELTVLHAVLLAIAMLIARPLGVFERLGKSASRWVAAVCVGSLLTTVVVQAAVRFSHSISAPGGAYAALDSFSHPSPLAPVLRHRIVPRPLPAGRPLPLSRRWLRSPVDLKDLRYSGPRQRWSLAAANRKRS